MKRKTKKPAGRKQVALLRKPTARRASPARSLINNGSGVQESGGALTERQLLAEIEKLAGAFAGDFGNDAFAGTDRRGHELRKTMAYKERGSRSK